MGLRILGIDPGTNFLGFAVIEVNQKKPTLMEMGVLKLKYVQDPHQKLNQIYVSVTNLIIKYSIEEFAIEAPFFGKNVQAMLKLGRAQGVAMAAAINQKVIIKEYSPKKVKMAITGNGNASKEQVARMLPILLKSAVDQKSLDATDALAVATCHFFNFSSNEIGGGQKRYSGWSAYIKDNPDKI